MKIIINKNNYLIIFVFFIQSCACRTLYEVDNGKKCIEKGHKYRYSYVPIETKGLEIRAYLGDSKIKDNGFITITRTAFSPSQVEDNFTFSKKVLIINVVPIFPNGIILEKKTRYDEQFSIMNEYYTCNDFSNMVKRNKYLHLKVMYDIDSLGFITHHKREFYLIRKRYYRLGLH